MTEGQLIREARAGDGSAWEALTRMHQEQVFRYAYLLQGDPDEAQDVVQETFVRAFYSLRRFQDGRPLRPWLLQIASRLASNRRRSARRLDQAIDRLGRQPAPEPQDRFSRDDADQLWAAMRRLRPAFQQVIYLRFFLDLDEGQTAASLGVPQGTVKSRLHRALAALRIIVAQEFPDLMESFSA